MTALKFMQLLRKLGACEEARTWAKGKDLHEVWTSCDRADWLLWLAGRMADEPGWPTRKQIVLAACACAETALRYVKPGEDRPRIAIETARAWVRGEASIEDVRLARKNAYAAAAAYAAYAAAYAAAAYAAYAAAAAYDAAAAYAAAYAADAAYAAAAADATPPPPPTPTPPPPRGLKPARNASALIRRELPEPLLEGGAR